MQYTYGQYSLKFLLKIKILSSQNQEFRKSDWVENA
jgi:hypothetical protein